MQRFLISFCFLLACAVLAPWEAFAQSSPSRIQVELLIDHENLQPSETSETPAARIGVLLHIEPGWHTYWQNSGEAAIPTRVSWQLPPGFRVDPLRWPVPERFSEKGSITTYGYRDEVLLWTNLYTEQVLPSENEKVELGVKVSWLVCKEICVPGQQISQIEVPFSTSLSLQPSKAYPIFEKYAAVTPLPLGEGKDKSRSQFKFSLTPFADPSNPKNYFLEFRFPVNGPQDISDKAQLFPYSANGVAYSPALGSLNSEQAILRLPFRQTSGLPESLHGIIVLAPETNSEKRFLALEWSIPTAGLTSAAPAPAEKESFHALRFHTEATPEHTASVKPAASQGSLWSALLCAFLAGMLLNLMPCVLPIISIKIMGFVCHAADSPKKALHSSLTFAAGILFSFLVLALILISFRSAGTTLGWGFQFQFPEFVAALLFIVFLLSLALFELYTVQLPFMETCNNVAEKAKSPFLRNFFDGVLATLLSTPCTAPILGTALVFAFAQPPIYTVLIFLTIGLGLALPYVYLSTHPKLLARLPKPGDWMYHFRQVMGFLLLGTCAWLLSVLDDLTEKGAVWSVVSMLLLYFLLWARKVAIESKPERGRSLPLHLLFFGTFLLSSFVLYPQIVAKRGAGEKGPIAWTPYSAEVLTEAMSREQGVFIDFTASWCITCKFNEFRLIETEKTADVIKKLNILPVKADWTSGDEAISAALKSYGAEGVPLYVIIPKSGKDPIVLSTLPSQSSLLDALQKAVE